MRIDVLTLFPEAFESVLGHSMLGRAREKGILEVALHDIRAHSTDKHRRADDYPFGGGAGLIMTVQPICDAVDHVLPLDARIARRIYLSPRGKKLDQPLARELAGEGRLLLLCGHYEGVDQRALDECVFEELSIGDYVLTGGELAAMVLIDAVSRHLPGVLGSEHVHDEESFSDGLLEYPQYTRPQVFRGRSVPEVLLSGHHKNIAAWRREQSRQLTERLRPELLGADLDPERV